MFKTILWNNNRLSLVVAEISRCDSQTNIRSHNTDFLFYHFGKNLKKFTTGVINIMSQLHGYCQKVAAILSRPAYLCDSCNPLPSVELNTYRVIWPVAALTVPVEADIPSWQALLATDAGLVAKWSSCN